MTSSRKTYYTKLRALVHQWEVRSDHGTESQDKEAGDEETLEAFLERLKHSEHQPYERNSRRNDELLELVNSFGMEELSDFITDLLIEAPELMQLPLFEQTKYANSREMAFDWVMGLPYATLQKIQDIFQKLYEEVLMGNTVMTTASVLEKINAIVIKNRTGLPIGYLIRRLKDPQLPQESRLQLGNLLINHEEYDLDFKAVEQLLQVDRQEFFLPILIMAYLQNIDQMDRPGKLKVITRSLSLLNFFRPSQFSSPSQYAHHYMVTNLETIGRAMRRMYPGDWQEQLSDLLYDHAEIQNKWLTSLLKETLLPLLPTEKSAAKITNETIAPAWEGPTFDATPVVLEELRELSLAEEVKQEEAQRMIRTAIQDEVEKETIILYLTAALRRDILMGAAEYIKPYLTALGTNGVDVREAFKAAQVDVTLYPYRIDAPFMHEYSETDAGVAGEVELSLLQVPPYLDWENPEDQMLELSEREENRFSKR